MAKTKTARRAATPRVAPLDKNDPRVRAAAVEILDDIFKKANTQRAERAEKTAAENEAQRKANIEVREKKEAKKRKSHKSIVSRLGRIAEPLQAIHDTANLAFAADDHEAALIVASNLSMLCLKRLDDCLVDLGQIPMGYADEWLTGEYW